VLRLSLGLAIAMGLLPGQQSPPVFKAEAYAITNFVVMTTRGGQPTTGLTVADFSITLDKKIAVPLGVSEDPAKPAHYVLSFNPPDSLRDGKTHQIDVKIKGPDGKWRTLPLKWKAVFAKPQ
jgi:hypothetical protein